MDFSLRTAVQKVGGLNIGLCPGIYEGKQSRERCLYVPETAFGFLEPSVKRNSGKFGRPYSHWGITEIPREEWQAIIQDWEQLKKDISSANNAEEICHAHPMHQDLTRELEDCFDYYKATLLKMIDELRNWICNQLTKYDQITVLGI